MLASYVWKLYSASGWLHAKMALLALMLVYHYFCGVWLFDFKHNRNQHSHVY